MRIAVIADVHANLPALRAVIEDVTAIGCDAVWCAGDVVGRGPHPNEVVEEMRRLAIPTVQGNWDEALGMGREVDGRHLAVTRRGGGRLRIAGLDRFAA